MEEIKHFSHEDHPLKLLNLKTVIVDGGGTGSDDKKPGAIACYACEKTISSGFVYGCTQCRYFKHKACAQLPLTIYDHSLYPYPFKLIDCRTMNFRNWICDVCRQSKILGFFYSFKYDNIPWFTACIDCCVVELARKAQLHAIKEEAKIKIEHEGHPQHTLTLQLRPGAFHCDACNAKDEGLFYRCDSCDFWIHKTCSSLAPTIHLPHHPNHPLVLVYSLPERFFKFSFYCEFCSIYIRWNEWLYHCANCRYFAHIRCALNAKQPSTSRDGPSISAADEDVHDLLHFPMAYSFKDPLKLVQSENMVHDYDETTNINHWSHHHALILNVEPETNMYGIACSDPIEVCHGCVQPLSLPYYSCKDGCSFTLHKYCAELPLKLEHPLHPNHSLDLINTWGYEYHYQCIGCFSFGNTFVYRCQSSCGFYIDVNCAFLPKTIKHKSHKHPLIQVIDPEPLCNACNKCYDGISYACKACNFILDIYCAMRSPNSLAHRYCRGHEIPLMYPPIMDHPEDFFCDICETEMHPKFPLYYCHKCKNCFHLDCISRVNYFENIIYEGTKDASYHKHPLTFVRRKKTPKYVCSICNCDINGYLILECQARVCNFNICYECHCIKVMPA
ncbi:hypothetical protein L2E82_48003 [Cichorium intybus]|uniref:Uncharacterized protein n=1 Tax=Cichorium intybus TaxID=13427 RepID=A0ACB8YXA0_CICIN|nr:hypothetical protein L2E82_48003 [Cichorium intybus]